MSEYIHVEGWDKFQHYKDRWPAWIKVHTDLHHRDEFLSLQPGARAVLISIWIEYAASNRQVPFDTRKLSRRFNMRVTSAQLDSLIQAGFIHVSASAPLAQSREEESREEKPGFAPREMQPLEKLTDLRAWKVTA